MLVRSLSRQASCGGLSGPEAIAGERDKEGERRHEDIIDPAQPGRQPDRAEQDNQQRRGAADHSNERAGDAGLQKRCVLHAAVLIPPGGPDSRHWWTRRQWLRRRSEERRVGQEWVGSGGTRWAPYH